MSGASDDLEKLIADAAEDFRDGNLEQVRLQELRELLLSSPRAREAFLEHNLLTQELVAANVPPSDLEGVNAFRSDKTSHTRKVHRSGKTTRKNPFARTRLNKEHASLQKTAWIAIAASLLLAVCGFAFFLNLPDVNEVAKNGSNRSSTNWMESASALRPNSSDRPVAVTLEFDVDAE